MTRRAYALLGASVLTIGVTTLFVSLAVVASEPGAVVAVAVLVLGIVLVSLGHTRPEVPPSLALLLARAGYDNTARLLEETGVRSRAVYLPSSMCGDTPMAAIPADGNTTLTYLQGKLASRLIVRDGEDGLALLLATPGSYSLGLLDAPVGRSLDEAETALTTLACGSLGLATAVHIGARETGLQVTFEGYAEPQRFTNGAVEACLGSPLAGIAATVLAESLQCPVVLQTEERSGRGLVVHVAARESAAE